MASELSEPLTHNEQAMSDNWKFCALGERIKKEGRDLSKVKDLTPDAIKLGFDFAAAVKRRDSTQLLWLFWSKLKDSTQYGEILMNLCSLDFPIFLSVIFMKKQPKSRGLAFIHIK